jgi:hypothetical protein
MMRSPVDVVRYAPSARAIWGNLGCNACCVNGCQMELVSMISYLVNVLG